MNGLGDNYVDKHRVVDFVAAASTSWICGRGLSVERNEPEAVEGSLSKRPSLLTLINRSGGEPIQLILGIIPMLLSIAVIIRL